jgi:hypothetical protein
VALFKRESLHERLAREGGIEPPIRSGVQGWKDLVGIHGLARQREWDAVVTADAPEVDGSEVEFVALPDGSLLVEREEGDAALEPLAAAVEDRLAVPYRARGVRQTETLWAVSARKIDVARFEAAGETIELTQTQDGRALRVDGMPSFESVPPLERLGEAAGSAYAIQAERLDADLWEVRVAAL